MSKKMTEQQRKVELLAERDVRKFIDALQKHYYELKKNEGITGRQISDFAGMDTSSFSKVLTGKVDNPNIRTLAKIFRAMNMRMHPHIENVSDIAPVLTNSSASYDYDCAKWRLININHQLNSDHKIIDDLHFIECSQGDTARSKKWKSYSNADAGFVESP